MATDRNCKICGKAVTPERLARFPVAVLCGRANCAVLHARKKSKLNQERMRADYFAWRRATGKIPAERAPVASERGALRRLGMM